MAEPSAPNPGADPAGGGAGNGGNGGHANGGPANGGQAGASWRDGLPDALRTEPTLENIKGVGDLAEQFVNAQRLIGRKGMILPPADAKPEEWDPVWNQLGRPESPDKYDLGDFKPVEGVSWDAEAQKAALAEMHKLGLSNAQAKGVFSLYNGYLRTQLEGLSASLQQREAETTAAMDKHWGAAKEARLALAKRAAQAFGLEGAQIDGLARLAGDFKVMDAFARIGEHIQGDDALVGAGGRSGFAATTPASAAAEIRRIRSEAAADRDHPYVNRKHPEHQAMADRMEKLYQIAGSAAAEGAR